MTIMAGSRQQAGRHGAEQSFIVSTLFKIPKSFFFESQSYMLIVIPYKKRKKKEKENRQKIMYFQRKMA